MTTTKILLPACVLLSLAACTAGDDGADDGDRASFAAMMVDQVCPPNPGDDDDDNTNNPRNPKGPGVSLGLAGTREGAGPAATGAKWVRTDFRWDGHMPKRDQTEVNHVKDGYVKNAVAGGAKVLGVLAYAPLWARDAKCQETAIDVKKQFCEPVDAEDYGRFAGMMAKHYKDLGGGAGVHAWEIWNEANSKYFWQPKPNVPKYTAMLKAAYKAIKAVDPSAIVVAGGTASLGIYQPGDEDADRESFIDPRDFLRGIYLNGGKDSFDAVSHHPYMWTTPGAPTNDENWWSMFGDPTTPPATKMKNPLRKIMDNWGDRDKNIWVTEFGIPGGVTLKNGQVKTEQSQAERMVEAYMKWRTYADKGAGPFFYFNYQDFDTSSKIANDHYGLIESTEGTPGCKDGKPTGNAKQAYCHFMFIAGIK